MLKKKNNTIEMGDRFIKKGEPKIVWIVKSKGSSIAMVPHYQVVREDYESRVRTLSENVLLDTGYYHRVD